MQIISYQELMMKFPPFLAQKNFIAKERLDKQVNDAHLLALSQMGAKIYEQPCVVIRSNLVPYICSLSVYQDDFWDCCTPIFDILRFCAIRYQDDWDQGVVPIVVEDHEDPRSAPAILGIMDKSLPFIFYAIADQDSLVFRIFGQ